MAGCWMSGSPATGSQPWRRVSRRGRPTDAAGRLVLPGLVESHIHLDKACILDRVPAGAGDVQAAIRAVGAAKRDFTVEDIVRRGGEVLRRVVGHGTMRVRAQTEVDPRIGLRGFDSVRALREAWRWALDLEVCVFAQEGLTDSPETEALLRAALRCGATVIGGAPYADRDPIGQLERVFALADEFDVDIDLHLDMGEDASGMLAETVCRLTGERRRGVGSPSVMSRRWRSCRQPKPCAWRGGWRMRGSRSSPCRRRTFI